VLEEAGIMPKTQPPDDVFIGKFDILATYTYSSFAATKGLTARELWRAAA
jgi:hypothetical protein